MKRYLLPLMALFIVVCGLTSCLGDEEETVTYDDTGLIAFSLGTLNRYQHTTTATGADSIYKSTITGGNYKFYIDQLTHEIYNPDSLPCGTDVAHVICSLTTKNAGRTAIQSMISDSLFTYNASDSLDFTQPRKFWVYSNRGTSKAIYTIRVNVHQEEGDVFKWSLLKDQEQNIATTPKLQMAATGNHALAFLLTSDGSSTVMMDLTKRVAEGSDSEFEALELGADAIDNVVMQSGKVLVLSGGDLHVIGTDDNGGLTLTKLTNRNTDGIARLVGASTKEIYALGTDGRLKASVDQCLTWTDEPLDNEAALLPTDHFNCITQPLRTNPEVEHVILTGTREGQTQAEVWMKLVDTDKSATDAQWMRVEQSSRADQRLYAQEMLTVSPYDEGLLSFGYVSGAFAPILLSKDGGINWRQNGLYTFPEGFSSTSVFAAAVDGQQNIWMACGGSGQIWRGRLNRLGWAQPQKVFTE